MSIKKSLLYLLLMASLVLLPMQALMANSLPTGHVDAASVHTSIHLAVDDTVDASFHQHDDQQVSFSSHADDPESKCHDHDTACGACAPMAVVSLKIRANFLKGVDVYQHFHVPLSVVFLASDIRPPIS